MGHLIPVGTSSGTSTLTNVVSATVPVGTQAGDLMIGSTSCTTSTQPGGAPAGWSLIEETEQWESRTLELWWGFVPDPPPASYQFTMNGNGSHTLTLRAYRNAHASDPIGASSVDQHSDPPGGTSMVIPSITTTNNNAIVLAVVGGEVVSWTVPATMLPELWDYTWDGAMSQAGAEQLFAAPSVVGTRTFTASASTGAGGIMVEIIPAVCDVLSPKPLYIPHKARLHDLARDLTDDGIERASREQFDNLKVIERWAAEWIGDPAMQPDGTTPEERTRCVLRIPFKDHSSREPLESARQSFDNWKAIERWSEYIADGSCGCNCYPDAEPPPDRCRLHIPYKDCLTDLDLLHGPALRVAADREFANHQALEVWANRYARAECGCTS